MGRLRGTREESAGLCGGWGSAERWGWTARQNTASPFSLFLIHAFSFHSIPYKSSVAKMEPPSLPQEQSYASAARADLAQSPERAVAHSADSTTNNSLPTIPHLSLNTEITHNLNPGTHPLPRPSPAQPGNRRRAALEREEWWTRLAGFGETVQGLDDHSLRRDWSSTELCLRPDIDADDEGSELDAPLPSQRKRLSSSSLSREGVRHCGQAVYHDRFEQDYFGQQQGASTSSTPSWSSPATPFAESPLFSPAGLGACSPALSTAPSSPATNKGHSRHASLSLPAVEPASGPGGNSLGLNLFGGVEPLQHPETGLDTDAALASIVQESDRYSLGSLITKLVSWTLSASAAETIDLTTDVDATPSPHDHIFSLGPTLYDHEHKVHDFWSPLSDLASHQRDSFRSLAFPAAFAHSHSLAKPRVDTGSCLLTSSARLEVGELEDYELTWETGGEVLEEGVAQVVRVLVGMGSIC